MERKKPIRRYDEEVEKEYFKESFEEYRADCEHAEMCFEYKGQNYFIDNCNAYYRLVDAEENINVRHPKPIIESGDLDEFMEMPFCEDGSIKSLYGSVRTYTEVFPKMHNR